MSGRALLMLVSALLVMASPPSLLAQSASGSAIDELELLQQAQQAEAEGDIVAAEEMLGRILSRNPGSLSAILSMERLLRMQGRLEEVLPLLDALLERDPNSPIGHQLTLRMLSMLDRTDDLERAQERWIETAPALETPYREAARVWTAREEAGRAVDVLRRGRARLGGDALSYELGSAYAAAGDAEAAAREWQRTIGTDAGRFSLVQRRMGTLPDGGAAITPRLIVALKTPPTTTARVRAALTLALGAGFEEDALELARAAQARLPAAERPAFLLETGRHADAAGAQRLAYWAYDALLGSDASDIAEPMAVRRRLAELAIAIGDTTAARRAYGELMEQAGPGSGARRAAQAAEIELGLRDADLDGAQQALAAFREQYPDAPETDRLAAGLADALLETGRADDARALLEGVRGAHSRMVRARLDLAAGDPMAARSELLAAAPGLSGTEATEAIALATLLGRVSPAGARRLAAAHAALAAGAIEQAIDSLTMPSLELRGDERAALLEYAGRIADRDGRGVQAESIRRILIEEHPHEQETAGALLALARALAERPGDAQEARALLERLIIEHPRSALVPQARRLLADLNRTVPRS